MHVTVKDFAIKAPGRVRAGELSFEVSNRGPDAHELIVVRSDSTQLPLRADGETVDEDALSGVEAGALEPGAAHLDRTLKVHLSPGRYVLFCNMAGHYFGGMRHELVVQ